MTKKFSYFLNEVEVMTSFDNCYIWRGPAHHCAYCGALADTADHTVPRWLVRGNVELLKKYKFLVVKSCYNCNMLAGDIVDKTFLERRARIGSKLKRKAKKLLKTAYYDAEYIESMGFALKSMMLEAIEKANAIRERLKVLESIILPEGVPDNIWIEFEEWDK